MTLTQHPRPGRRRPRLLAVAVVGALAVALLAACAGSAGGDSAATSERAAGSPALSSGSQPKAADGSAPGAGQGADGSDDTTVRDSSAGAVGAAALQQRRQVRTAQVAVRVKDVDTAVSSARAFATAAQGFVSDEQTATTPVAPDARAAGGAEGDPGTTVPPVVVSHSVLTLRVPQQSLDQVMEQVAGLGAVLSRSQTSEDVTDTYVDVTSRVKTQRASVERVRTLLSRATGIGDVVRLESELSRREADLESLEARLAALDDSTTLGTLVVSFSRPDVAIPNSQQHEGFVGGLLDGWHALGQSTAVVLKVVGAIIPFAVLLALLGLPLWLALRRRRRHAPAASA